MKQNSAPFETHWPACTPMNPSESTFVDWAFSERETSSRFLGGYWGFAESENPGGGNRTDHGKTWHSAGKAAFLAASDAGAVRASPAAGTTSRRDPGTRGA